MTAPSGLDPSHAGLIASSAISDAVRDARGYETVRDLVRFGELGWNGSKPKRAALSGLVIPLWDVRGKRVGCQVRPDRPRVDAKGRARKYESPPGQANVLDVNPRVQPLIDDPSVKLWVCEGVRKGDALASAAECAVSISGVYGWRGRGAKGAPTALADWEAVGLKGRDVLLAPDSDVGTNPNVRTAVVRLAKFLESRGANVTLVQLPAEPGTGAKVGVDDYLGAGHSVADLERLTVDRFSAVPRADASRPVVMLNSGQFRDDVDAATAALLDWNNPPEMFRYGATLARLRNGDDGRSEIDHLGEPMLQLTLSRAADFFRGGANGPKAATPGRDLVRAIMAEADPRFPALKAVASAPVVRRDFTIANQPGYDPATGVFLDFGRAAFPAVSDSPTQAEIAEAVKLLCSFLDDFPYADPASRANAFAIPVSAIVRHAIEGPVPAFAITSPQVGEGKGLLTDTAGIITTGAPPHTWAPPSREYEWGAGLLAAMRTGRPLIKLDNLEWPVRSPAFAAALTAWPGFTGRELGVSRMLTVAALALFILTGRNLQLGGDIPRRVVWVSLDAKTDRPEQRDGFARSLPADAYAMRPQLVAAVLTLVRAWAAAERPAAPDLPAMATFNAWRDIVGGILHNAGIRGFLGNYESRRRAADEDAAERAAFLDAWLARFGSEPVRVAAVHQALQNGELGDTLPARVVTALDGKTAASQGKRLGNAFAAWQGVRHGSEGLRLERGAPDTHAGTATWCVLVGGPHDEEPAGFTEPAAKPASNPHDATNRNGGFGGFTSGSTRQRAGRAHTHAGDTRVMCDRRTKPANPQPFVAHEAGLPDATPAETRRNPPLTPSSARPADSEGTPDGAGKPPVDGATALQSTAAEGETAAPRGADREEF